MTDNFIVLHPGIEDEDVVPKGTRLAPRLDTLQGRRMALLDNGKINGDVVLAAFARRLKRLGVSEVASWQKQYAGADSPDLIQDLLRWKPDFALGAVGD
jgi:hypothetical protein